MFVYLFQLRFQTLVEGIKEQTHQSLRNIGEVLKAAGADYNNGLIIEKKCESENDFQL